MTKDTLWERLNGRRFSRRRLLTGAAATGVGIAGLALVGCGDDDDDDADDAEPTQTQAPATETAEPGTETPAATSSPSNGDGGDVTSRLSAIFPDPVDVGATAKMASVLALSGPGSYYGQTMSNGIDLAVKHIASIGGPQIDVRYIDHRSGDATAGQNAAREIASAGDIPFCLSSYGAVIGSMLPVIQQEEILVLDGGGGNGPPFDSQPFFWGTRAWTSLDSYRGFYQFLKQVRPEARTVASVWWDIGAPLETILGLFREILEEEGFELVADERTAIGQTDYSTVIARLRSLEADIVDQSLFGLDTGFFMQQYVEAGISAQVVGHEFTPDAAEVAGPAYDNYWFAYDFFGEANATSDWGLLFREEFMREYGTEPDFYAANFYEDTFIYWELLQRLAGDGGDVSGPSLQEALMADPTFKIVYGGNGSEIGTMTFDLENHGVTKPQGVFNIKDGKPNLLANINREGLIDVVEEPA